MDFLLFIFKTTGIVKAEPETIMQRFAKMPDVGLMKQNLNGTTTCMKINYHIYGISKPSSPLINLAALPGSG